MPKGQATSAETIALIIQLRGEGKTFPVIGAQVGMRSGVVNRLYYRELDRRAGTLPKAAPQRRARKAPPVPEPVAAAPDPAQITLTLSPSLAAYLGRVPGMGLAEAARSILMAVAIDDMRAAAACDSGGRA